MFKENIPLHTLTSYRIGGPARYFFEAKTVAELKLALEETKKKNLEFLVLGGGTNFLIGDEGFPGLVLKPNFDFIKTSGKEVSVGAGTPVSVLLDYLSENGLSGLEWAGGLPGTVGGAIRGNAGAFGGEIKDIVKSVRSVDTKNLNEVERDFSECDFGYRSSVFKKNSGEDIIISAVLNLEKGDSDKIKKASMKK